MGRYIKDHGLVLKRIKLKDDSKLVTVFTRENGKISLFTFGARRPTSRRVSHLQTGNYIAFTALQRGDYVNLSETEMVYAYPFVRENDFKINLMFLAFFVLDKILAEAVSEPQIFSLTTRFLKGLDQQSSLKQDETLFDLYLKDILVTTGFAAITQVHQHSFDALGLTEQLLNRRLRHLIA